MATERRPMLKPSLHVLKSSTIDIPVKTSDAFYFSRTKPREKKLKVYYHGTSIQRQKAGINEDRTRRIIPRVKISGDNRGKAAREGSKKVEEAKKKLNTEKGKSAKK